MRGVTVDYWWRALRETQIRSHERLAASSQYWVQTLGPPTPNIRVNKSPGFKKKEVGYRQRCQTLYHIFQKPSTTALGTDVDQAKTSSSDPTSLKSISEFRLEDLTLSRHRKVLNRRISFKAPIFHRSDTSFGAVSREIHGKNSKSLEDCHVLNQNGFRRDSLQDSCRFQS